MLRIRLHPFYEADKGAGGNDTTHEEPPTPPTTEDERNVDEECDRYIGELLDHIDKLTARIDELERNGRTNPTNPELPKPEPEPEPEETHWAFRRIGGKR